MTALLRSYEPVQLERSKATTTRDPQERTVLAETQATTVVAIAGMTPADSAYVPEMIEGLPVSLVEGYADLALRHAIVTEIEPGMWFAQVHGLDGAWGDGTSSDAALAELREAIVGWVAVKRRFGAKIPTLEGLDLNDPLRA